MISWLWFGIIAYFFFAVSTLIDKHMMNLKFPVVKTSMIKMFFNGVVLVIVGLLFFNISIEPRLLYWGFFFGLLYAVGHVLYYITFRHRDASEVSPFVQSGEILMIFLGSLLFLGETANIYNFLGVFLILIGLYSVIAEDKLKLPKIDRVFWYMIIVMLVTTIYYLFVKQLLETIKPINIAIVMYFFTSAILFVFYKFYKDKRENTEPTIPIIITSSFFGALGTLAIYLALEIGLASKVYPVSGIYSVFIFILALIFLKEKFYWHRLFGIAAVFIGIFLVSI